LRGPLAFAAFSRDDPLPAIVDLPLTIWRTLKRGFSMPVRNRSAAFLMEESSKAD